MILTVGLVSTAWRASARQIAAVVFPLQGCPQITTSAIRDWMQNPKPSLDPRKGSSPERILSREASPDWDYLCKGCDGER